jgi:hypothetical protein
MRLNVPALILPGATAAGLMLTLLRPNSWPTRSESTGDEIYAAIVRKIATAPPKDNKESKSARAFLKNVESRVSLQRSALNLPLDRAYVRRGPKRSGDRHREDPLRQRGRPRRLELDQTAPQTGGRTSPPGRVICRRFGLAMLYSSRPLGIVRSDLAFVCLSRRLSSLKPACRELGQQASDLVSKQAGPPAATRIQAATLAQNTGVFGEAPKCLSRVFDIDVADEGLLHFNLREVKDSSPVAMPMLEECEGLLNTVDRSHHD